MEEINNKTIILNKNINLFEDNNTKIKLIQKKKEKCKTPIKINNNLKQTFTYNNINKLYNNNNELIIKKLSKKIKLNYHKNNSYNYPKYQTLYKIFHGEAFNIDTLIYYLSKEEKDNYGITDELINFLYSKFQNDSLFYIPQLCSLLTYKKYITPIENYILDSCVDRIKFSITAFWMIFANQNEKMEKMQHNIEMTLVNNRRATLNYYKYRINYNKNIKNKNINENENNIFEESIIKQYKSDYFDYVLNFYEDLTDLCQVLKDTSKNERDLSLQEYIYNINKKIRNEKKKSKENIPQLGLTLNYFYEGILLPFNDDIDTTDSHCNIIVNILPELSKCYHSKARVPILLTVECVKLYEIQEKQKLKEIQDNKNKEMALKSVNDYINHNKKIEKEEKNNNSKVEEYIYIPDQDDFNSDIKEIFGKKFSKITMEHKLLSKYCDYKTYSLKSFIFKSNDDLRQELLVLQLIKKFKSIFDKAGICLKLYPYEILIISKESGIIEFLPNTLSIDQIKKKYPKKDLNKFFRHVFYQKFEIAQKNFCESLAAYSLICYFLEIRDRHNGNILIDINGNLIHIDFGYILGIGPGQKTYEQAPFKLTKEYVEIMDGINSSLFQYFKTILFLGFIEARKNFETLWKIIEITYHGNKDLPCFKDRDFSEIQNSFIDKFLFDKPEIELSAFVEPLIKKSYNNSTTNNYDSFQFFSNGID